ncbi:MAG TPA: acetylglutamate kinase [Bryobacteraceae bacterium]|nr:acetylglutamate kinase [Bryobacteraceae bacterium]
MKLLIKLGGTLLDAPECRARLAAEITEIARSHQVVVVHGGGKQMTRYLAERNVESRFVNGMRVTTPEVVDAVLKVFAGSVNSQLVGAFRAAGASPVGLTGLDSGLVDAEPLAEELGAVGKPVRSDARLLTVLTRDRYLPVVACVAGDAHGAVYNVNADQMAVACASSYGAQKLIFLTDVDGVKGADGQLLPSLTAAAARALVENGIATGGMQAKLEAAMGALQSGVAEIVIAPGAKAGIVEAILAAKEIGTRVVS